MKPFQHGRLTALLLILSCSGPMMPTPKSAAYEAELINCSTSSSTLAESIACENKVRARYGRPARVSP